MSSRDLALLPGAIGQKPTQIVYGEVSLTQPAPATFTSPLYVVIPDYSTDFFWKIDNWPACHGSTLPQPGADCLLIWDNQGTLRCVWWSAGSTDFVPTGSSALLPGDLITSAAISRAGCLLCDGTSYLTTDHPDLFAAIGHAYGGSGGSFHVPDLRGRAPVGAGTGTAAGATAHALGSQPTSGAGGEETHTLSSAELQHDNALGVSLVQTNSATSGTTDYVVSISGVGAYGPISATSGGVSASSATAHNIMQPLTVVNWFIKT